MKRFFVLPVFTAMVISSCHYINRDKINGSGKVITQNRSFSGFTDVDVSNSIVLYVRQDSVFSVRVETDDNLQQYIITRQDGNTLHIEQKDNTHLDATGKIKVYVSAPAFKNLDASGACHIKGETLLTATDEIDVDVSGASSAELELKAPRIYGEMTGASHLKLKGQTKDLRIEGTGASHAHCFDLLSENTDVDVTGASSAEVFASVKLNAGASGASDVRYKGNAEVGQNVSGAASVKKAE
ncbi:MAG: head GIN domain-containing protein [Chitinophagaceae bacterium]